MTIPAILIFVEGLLCKLIFNPTESTDMSVISFMLLMINSIAVYRMITQNVKEKKFQQMLILSLLLRVAVAIWDIYARDIYIIPNTEADAVGYRSTGLSYAFGERAGIVNYKDYSYYLGILFRAFGKQFLMAEFVNIYLAICALTMVYKVLKIFGVDFSIVNMALFFGCFLPNSIIINTTTLQEGVIAYFIIASVYAFVKWWVTNRKMYVLLGVLSSIAGGYLHIGGLVSGICILFSYPFVNNRERQFRVTTGRMLIAVILLAGALLFLNTNGTTFLGKIGGEISTKSIVTSTTDPDSVSDSDYLDIGISGLPATLDLIVNTPIRVFYFVCSPLPWMWRGLGDILAFCFSSSFYAYVIYACFKVLLRCPKEKRRRSIWAVFMVLLLVVLLGAMMFGWGVSNTGTALRHREKYVYVAVALYGVTKQLLQNKVVYRGKNFGHRTSLQR